jgi:sterol 14-demethylase
MEELYQEQIRVLGSGLPPLTYDNLQKLDLQAKVIKETLRLHAPIHSIIRAVKNPMAVDGTSYVIPTSHNVLSSPGVTARSEEHFPNPLEWDPHRWDENIAASAEDDEKVDYGYGLVNKGTNSPYLPFGAGRHRCIGEQFAYLQLGTITAVLVRLFKFRNLPGVDGVPDTDYSVSYPCPIQRRILLTNTTSLCSPNRWADLLWSLKSASPLPKSLIVITQSMPLLDMIAWKVISLSLLGILPSCLAVRGSRTCTAFNLWMFNFEVLYCIDFIP